MMGFHGTVSDGGAKTPAPRSLILALVLGLLVVLVSAVMVSGFATHKTHTTLEDFDAGEFYFTGLLDIPAEEIDSVQLLPVGLEGDWQLSKYPLKQKLTDLSVAASGNRLYVVGGSDDYGNITDTAYLAEATTPGELAADWQLQTLMPEGRAAAGSAITPLNAISTALYIVGGRDPARDRTKTVIMGNIDNATGQITSWDTLTETLDAPLIYAEAVAHKGFLYVLGGETIGGNPLSRVDYAPINADGSLDPFTSTSALVDQVYDGAAVVFEGITTDTLYYIGGRDNITSTPKVFFADFKPGGGLTPWQESEGLMPHHSYGHAASIINAGEIIVNGGLVNAINAQANISSTVKAALVDPENETFRLFDWCFGETNPAICSFGAWQTGALLPENRSFHGSATYHANIYVMGGQDEDLNVQNTVYFFTVTGAGSKYAPKGTYLSAPFEFAQTVPIRQLSWGATIGYPDDQGLTIQYRSRTGTEWTAWSDPAPSVSGTNDLPVSFDARAVQYQANFTTVVSTASPLLNWLTVYYDIDDPEVGVSKDTGDVITTQTGSLLEYTIYYTNDGGVTAENVVITETLPAHTTYAGGTEWQRVGTSNLYTFQAGNVAPGAETETTFLVRVDDDIPASIDYITNVIEIDYPPMYDDLNTKVTDPITDNNRYEMSNPLSHYSVAIAKEADPETDTTVLPGDQIAYTLSYRNNGEFALTGLALRDFLPARVTYVPGSIWPKDKGNDSDPKALRWNIGNLPLEASGEVGFVVTVNDNAPAGSVIENTFYAESDQTNSKDAVPVQHTVEEEPPPTAPILVLTKSATPANNSKVSPGDKIDYTLAYKNDGDGQLTDLVLTDVLPDEVTYVAGSIWPASKGDDNNAPTLKWTIGNLAPGASGTVGFSVNVKDNLPGSLLFENHFTGKGKELGTKESDKVWHQTVVQAADFVITSLAPVPAEPEIGEPFDLVVTVKNQGSQDADDGEFWVEVYIKPYPSAQPTSPADHYLGYCKDQACSVGNLRPEYAEYIYSLKAGESFPFRFEDLTLQGSESGIHEIFAQVDVCFEGHCQDPRWGWYAEESENNNIRRIVMSGSIVYIPTIKRNH